MHEIDLDQEPNQAPTVFEKEEVAAIVVRDHEPTSPFDIDPARFKMALDRRSENVNALLKWLASALVEGTHFGKIHVVGKDKCPAGARCTNPAHFSKNCLFKPGAEKINQFLGLTARYPNAWEYEQKALKNEPFEWIALRCELVSEFGHVVAVGMGCRKFTGDLNKDIKMAQKSGRVDATIQLGLSDCYTQDLDDMAAAGAFDRSMVVEAEIVASAAPMEPKAPLSPAVQEMLDKAKENREREQASLDKRGPVDRQALRDAGFQVAGCECGAEIGTYTHATKHYKFEQCSAVKERKVPFSKEHHYRRLG